MFDQHARNWRISLAALLWATLVSVTYSQPECDPDARDSRDCFSMGKTAVQFVPSERYETITFYSTESRRSATPPADFPIPDTLGTIVRLSILESAGTLLVALAENARRADVAAYLQRDGARDIPQGLTVVVGSDAERGSPVYSAGSVDRVLTNQVIVSFRARTSEEEIAAALRDATIISGPSPLRPDRLRYVVAFPNLTGREAAARASQLDRREDVEYAQPNFITVSPDRGGPQLSNSCPAECPLSVPAADVDPFFTEQWYLDNIGASGGSQGADINAKNAWQVTTGSPTIIIAILDQAVDTDHEDLDGKIHSTWNAHTGAADLDLQDEDVHGTAVAGIAAATTGNPFGIAAIGADIKLMAVQVMRHENGQLYYPDNEVADGIAKAAQVAHVLSGSFTLGPTSIGFPDVVSDIDVAIQRRVLVFAAGNDGAGVQFPANLSATQPIIAVSATDQSDHFKAVPDNPTSCDWGSNHGSEINVAAPGVRILTTDRTGNKGYCPENYAYIGGTSAATPLVAGTAALILSQSPGLSPAQVRERLEATAEDLESPGFDDLVGHGRIDACRALLGTNCERGERTIPSPPIDLRIQ